MNDVENKLSKEEFIELVKNLCNPKLSDEKVSKYIDILEENVPHPAPSDLIFWSDEELSKEEIVRITLEYKDPK
ncbi:bacteriocin immunity protein [Bacillus sp. FJAT-47783]|uniref:bacteriocin immunity protein n=1 Tax=Bacillus sp. FJAT-47783 TaxID=2922712 RepID=UPI001FAD29FA|nr:bacteriocin immunity protein [Bacillus sp. FJAT-47783]